VQVRARADEPNGAAPELLAERQPQLVALPHPLQARHRARRVGGHERAVDRADRGAHDQIRPDARLRERAEHADLVRAEQPAAAEDERRRHGSSVTGRGAA
jgi:hypothetical protein